MENNEDFMNNDPWNINGSSSGSSDTASKENGNDSSRIYFSAEDLGKISMALGIMSFFFYKGLFAILGLVFGFISQSKVKNSSATIGIVCSIINLGIICLGILGCIIAIAACIPMFSDMFSKLKDAMGSYWI